MKLPVIKKLVETATAQDLKAAEEALLNEAPLPIEIEGKDEGEKLTHILAALFILEEMKDGKTDYNTALRAYSARVRNSIS